MLYELLGSRNPPFFCDYCSNIFVGENFYANVNCTILDVCEVHIGDNVLLALGGADLHRSSSGGDGAAHQGGVEFGKPVRIGHNV